MISPSDTHPGAASSPVSKIGEFKDGVDKPYTEIKVVQESSVYAIGSKLGECYVTFLVA